MLARQRWAIDDRQSDASWCILTNSRQKQRELRLLNNGLRLARTCKWDGFEMRLELTQPGAGLTRASIKHDTDADIFEMKYTVG